MDNTLFRMLQEEFEEYNVEKDDTINAILMTITSEIKIGFKYTKIIAIFEHKGWRQLVAMINEAINSVKREDITYEECKDYSSIKSHLRIALKPRSKFDDKVISKPFLDVIAQIYIDRPDYCITVDKQYLNEWNISEDEVWLKAEINTYTATKIIDAVEYSKSMHSAIIEKVLEDNNFSTYLAKNCKIVSNDDNALGTGSLYCKGTLMKLEALLGTDNFIIVPLSVNEFAAVRLRSLRLEDVLKVHKTVCKEMNNEYTLTSNIYVYNGEELAVLE